MVNVIVIRKHTNGNFTYAAYLVDLLCLGVKDTYYQFNQDAREMEEFLDDSDQESKMLEIDYSLAHNIIFAGHDFAAEYHMPQHPDFTRTTRYLLEEDDEKIPLIDVHTGDENGLPHLLVTPANLQSAALGRLKQYAGEGNYRYSIIGSPFADDDPTTGFDDEQEEDDDDFEDYAFDDDDLDDDDLDDDVDDEFTPHFLHWNQDQWKQFILKMTPEKYSDYGAEIAYMYEKAITVPELAVRGMDIREMFDKALQRVDWDETKTEMTWLHSEQEKAELGKIYQRLFKDGNSSRELKQLVKELEAGIARWPRNPIFRNYLYNAYIMLEDKAKANKEMEDTLALFPDYLMAKTVYAGYLMKNGRITEVPGLLGNAPYLADLYSERRYFHINEFMHFNTAWLQYYLLTEDFPLADFYGSLLESLPENILKEQQEDLLELLMVRRFMDVTRIVAEAQNNTNELEQITAILAGSMRQPGLTPLL